MGCLSYLKDKVWQMFGWNKKKVGPTAETSMDFPGIDPKDLELKTLARLMSMVYPRGTEDRWKCLDERLRQELAEPGENWEERKPYPIKALIAKSRKVYTCRKPYVEMSDVDVARYMAKYDMVLIGPEAQAEAAGVEVSEGAEQTSETNQEAEKQPADVQSKSSSSDPHIEKPPIDKSRDFSNQAMKLLSMAERSEKGLREEGYEHGEIDPASFFKFLYKLKIIHGHMLPPPLKQDKKEEEKVVADAFFDIGCGAGKAVFAAAIFYAFKECRGVEAITCLHTAATDLQTRWTEEVAEKVFRKDTRIDFELGDMVESTEWETATYFFLNGPTFSEETMHKLAIKFNGRIIPPESVLIVAGKPYEELDKEKWSLIADDLLQMSWGKTKVFVYEKIPKKKVAKKKQKSNRDTSLTF